MKNILFIGGDTRMTYAASHLSDSFSVTTYGLHETNTDFENAVANADAIVLPVPSSVDGKTVYAPFAERPISLDDVLKYKCPDTPLLTDVPDRLRTAASTPYASSEAFTVKNACLTAENAVGLLIMSVPYSLQGKSIALCGYGRIGRALLRLLHAFSCRLTVFSAEDEKRAWASAEGAAAYAYDALPDIIKSCDILINTSVVRHLTEKDLSAAKRDFVYMELASKESGIPRKLIEEHHFTYIDGGKLPGKYSPQSAGSLIADAVAAVITGGKRI